MVAGSPHLGTNPPRRAPLFPAGGREPCCRLNFQQISLLQGNFRLEVKFRFEDQETKGQKKAFRLSTERIFIEEREIRSEIEQCLGGSLAVWIPCWSQKAAPRAALAPASAAPPHGTCRRGSPSTTPTAPSPTFAPPLRRYCAEVSQAPAKSVLFHGEQTIVQLDVKNFRANVFLDK